MGISPKDALRNYREQMPKQINREVAKFNDLSLSDRIELLFYMAMGSGDAVKRIAEATGVGVKVSLGGGEVEH